MCWRCLRKEVGKIRAVLSDDAVDRWYSSSSGRWRPAAEIWGSDVLRLPGRGQQMAESEGPRRSYRRRKIVISLLTLLLLACAKTFIHTPLPHPCSYHTTAAPRSSRQWLICVGCGVCVGRGWGRRGRTQHSLTNRGPSEGDGWKEYFGCHTGVRVCVRAPLNLWSGLSWRCCNSCTVTAVIERWICCASALECRVSTFLTAGHAMAINLKLFYTRTHGLELNEPSMGTL